MSAVAELSKPSTAVLFTAARADLRLVKKPRRPVWGPDGEQVDLKPGQTFQFRDGMLRVGDDGVPLEDGTSLAREEALAWLRKHRLYGNPHDGFTEIAQAAPAVSEAELSTLLAASADEEALERLIAEEEAGWAREELLRPARERMEQVARIKAELRAEMEAEEKSAPKRAAK